MTTRDGNDRAGSDGNVLDDRRRPGRRDGVSSGLIPLMRRPSAARQEQLARELRTFDAWELLEADTEFRPDPVRVLGIIGAVAFCLGTWFVVLRLLLG